MMPTRDSRGKFDGNVIPPAPADAKRSTYRMGQPGGTKPRYQASRDLEAEIEAMRASVGARPYDPARYALIDWAALARLAVALVIIAVWLLAWAGTPA